MSKILFIGDIVGKPGRRGLREVLPMWRKEYEPDAVVVNVENIAHGKGVTEHTLQAIDDLDIDCYTSGNHVFDKGKLRFGVFGRFSQVRVAVRDRYGGLLRHWISQLFPPVHCRLLRGRFPKRLLLHNVQVQLRDEASISVPERHVKRASGGLPEMGGHYVRRPRIAADHFGGEDNFEVFVLPAVRRRRLQLAHFVRIRQELSGGNRAEYR